MESTTSKDPRKQNGDVIRPDEKGAPFLPVVAPRQENPIHAPDPEVTEKATRRKFTAEYKRRILLEADACAAGEIGALLRREGLYASHLSTWRRQREAGELLALSPKKRGRKARPEDPAARRVRELERENERLRHRLQQAETIIEVQKKISDLLGVPRKDPNSGDSG